MAGVMKDSEVEWIGEIPEGWDISKVKYVGRYINGYAFKPDQWGQDGLPIIRIQNLSGSSKSINYFDGKISDDYLIDDGDILISWSATLDAFIWNYGKGWLNQHIFKAIPNVQKIHKSYFFHLMKIAMLNMSSDKHGSAMQHVTNQIFGNFQVPLPSLSEQKLIADFLDEKCAEIDKLSEDIQKQIDILNDYKKSVITRAVTKGLDPNAEMKDGRVDWAKNIPKTWKVTKLKYLFDFGKGLNITKADLVPEGLPVVSYGQIHSKLNDKTSLSEELLRFVDNRYQVRYPQCRIKQGDFVFADTSEDYEGCGNCVYKRDNSKVFAGYHSIILKAKQNSDNRYLAYLFTTDLWRKQIRTAVSGVKVFSITQNILSRASVILPPEKEKLIIADYLDGVCSDIEYSISAKYSQLENLTIYKKSIIYEYVTGKKRVKGEL